MHLIASTDKSLTWGKRLLQQRLNKLKATKSIAALLPDYVRTAPYMSRFHFSGPHGMKKSFWFWTQWPGVVGQSSLYVPWSSNWPSATASPMPHHLTCVCRRSYIYLWCSPSTCFYFGWRRRRVAFWQTYRNSPPPILRQPLRTTDRYQLGVKVMMR